MTKPLNRPRCVLDDVLDRADLSPTTRTQYERVIGSWLEFAGPDPKGWTQLTAQRFYDAMIARGVKTKTANTYMASLRLVSRWFHRQHGGADFAVVQQRIAPASPKRQAMSEETIKGLLKTCDGELPISRRPIDRRDRTLLVVGLETGMRRMSLVGMRLENIQVKPYPFVTVPVKGRGGHQTFDVPLSDTAMLVLKDWNGWLHTRGMKDGPVFTGLNKSMDVRGRYHYTPTGEAISMVRVYKLLEERAQEAGIEQHVHPHLLRNTFVTSRQMMGLNGPQIASITGHASFKGLTPDELSWGPMTTYVDLKVIGETARQSTPPWFAKYVEKMLEKD